MFGHRCSQCDLFKNKNVFDCWISGPRCIPKATGHTRKETFDTEQFFKRRKAETQAVELKSDEVEVSKQADTKFEAMVPTADEGQECFELNGESIGGFFRKLPNGPVSTTTISEPVLPEVSSTRLNFGHLSSESEDEETREAREINGDPKRPRKHRRVTREILAHGTVQLAPQRIPSHTTTDTLAFQTLEVCVPTHPVPACPLLLQPIRSN